MTDLCIQPVHTISHAIGRLATVGDDSTFEHVCLRSDMETGGSKDQGSAIGLLNAHGFWGRGVIQLQ